MAKWDHSRLAEVRKLRWMQFYMHLRLVEEKNERERQEQEAQKQRHG